MNEQHLDKRNYDVVTIRSGRKKQANHVKNALEIDPKNIKTTGKFIKVFSDIFLKKEAGKKAYI
jgi:hypothetical protein